MTDLRGRSWGSPPKDPGWVDRRILEILAGLPAFQTLDPRDISARVWRTTKYGRSNTAAALGRLKSRRLVEERRAHRYAISQAGRDALALAQELEPDGAA
jgi:hypothetical protein